MASEARELAYSLEKEVDEASKEEGSSLEKVVTAFSLFKMGFELYHVPFCRTVTLLQVFNFKGLLIILLFCYHHIAPFD